MVRTAVPAVAGFIVAVAMDRNRFFTSFKMLPGLLGDPFGLGLDLFGRAGAGLDPAPLGVTRLLVVQLAVTWPAMWWVRWFWPGASEAEGGYPRPFYRRSSQRVGAGARVAPTNAELGSRGPSLDGDGPQATVTVPRIP